MKKIIAMLLTLAMLVSMLAACGSNNGNSSDPGQTDPGTTSEDKDSVSLCVEGAISTLDPYETLAYTSWYVFNNIYETLVINDDDGNVQPCLATAWEPSEDGLVYTFTLVDGAKFHDGSAFTAEDAAYSLMEAKNHAAMNIYTNMIESAEATDDTTLTVTLNRPYASFVSLMSELPIVSSEFYAAQTNNTEVGCGTGPYMLESVDMNNLVVLKAFSDYRQGEAAIKTVNMKVISDASTAVVALESGDLDFLTLYNMSAYADLDANDKFETELCATLHTAYTSFNLEVEPLDNKLLRQALSYAIDYENVILVAYEGLAKRAYALMGENAFGADFSDMVKYEYNPEKAAELLAEAGFAGGLNFADYGVQYSYIPGGYHEKIAQCIQQNWADIGVTVELVANENIDSDAPAGNFQIATEGGTYTSDMAFMSAMYATSGIGSNNYSRYSNERVDELFSLADATTDSNERAAYYKEICEITAEDALCIPVQHKEIPYVWYKDLNAVVHLSSAHPWYVYEWSWN